MAGEVARRLLALAAWLSLSIPAAGCAQASGAVVSSDSPVKIPLTVTQNPRFGTYAAKITIALGDGPPLPFGFDTGSTGLHAFADAELDALGSGVRCSQTPTSVTYGNPPRITFNGVVCYATLHFDGLTTPSAVPVAYLTSASCPLARSEGDGRLRRFRRRLEWNHVRRRTRSQSDPDVARPARFDV
jgi:hypothetical protein